MSKDSNKRRQLLRVREILSILEKSRKNSEATGLSAIEIHQELVKEKKGSDPIRNCLKTVRRDLKWLTDNNYIIIAKTNKNQRDPARYMRSPVSAGETPPVNLNRMLNDSEYMGLLIAQALMRPILNNRIRAGFGTILKWLEQNLGTSFTHQNSGR